MTLYQVIENLKAIALTHPNVRTASEGNIYDSLNANPSIKYGVFFLTQGAHTEDEMYDHYNFSIFYVDRLEANLENNRIQIQSIGKEVLSNIIHIFCNEFDAEADNIIYHTFQQKFADETAGVYATITLDIIRDSYCEEEFE